MKIFVVVESYYHPYYGNSWERNDSYWVSEENAYSRLAQIDELYKEECKDMEMYSLKVSEIITGD